MGPRAPTKGEGRRSVERVVDAVQAALDKESMALAPRRFSLEELFALSAFFGVTVGPARDRVAYYGDQTGRVELYVLDLASGQSRQVSNGEVARSPKVPVAWAGDGTALIIPQDQGGDEQYNLARLDLATGRVARLTQGRGQRHPGRPSPVRPEAIVMSNHDDQMNVYLLDLVHGGTRRLTRFERPAYASDWSPDGEWLYLTANESPNLQASAVYRIRRDATGLERLYSSGEDNRDGAGRASPDGRYLAVASNASGLDQPGLLDLASGEVRFIGEGDGEEHVVDFSPDGRRVLVVAVRRARAVLSEFDIAAGTRRPVGPSDGVITAAAYLADGTILVEHADPTHRPALDAVDAAGAARPLLRPAYGSLSPAQFVAARDVAFASDARTIHGLLYKPAVEPGRRLGGVVWVHGGPTAQSVASFNAAVQLFANRGYAVLEVNYRGSTGYGKAFMEANQGDIGGGDARDVAAGARLLAADPDIDPGRIVCGGGSYGGYMTYRQLTHFPELWAGGVAIVGITDWAHMYGESMAHFKHLLHRLFGGSPDEVPERYRAASPIHEADRLRAPLLILHGLNDPRCPIAQARRFKDRLVDLGRREGEDFFYHELGDQGHGSADVAQRLGTYGMIDEFLARLIAAPAPSR